MSVQPSINQLARRVAKALDLRMSRTRVPKLARNMIHTSLLRARDGEPVDLGREVAAAARHILPDDERAYYTALFLLEYAWMLAPGSPAAREMVRLFRWYYDTCRTARHDLWEGLRAELTDCQWSSYPLVRQLAAAAQGEDAVTADEVAVLKDDLAPHESRFRVAERLLRNMQAEHLTDFFDYLHRLHADGTRTPPDPAAREGAEALLHMLGTVHLYGTPGNRQHVIDAMFMAYLKFADETLFSGRLQHLLAHAAAHSIPVLVSYARSNPVRLRPIARVLEHMTVHAKNELAGAALVELIETAPSQDRYRLVDLFLNAGRELARRRDTPRMLRDLFTQTADRFRGTTGGLSQLAAELDKLPWGKELSAADVIAYLDRTPHHLPVSVIRTCGQQGFDVISQYARDGKRDRAVRLRAVHTAIELNARFLHERVRDLLWELYQTDTSPEQEIKAAALYGVRQKDRQLTRQERLGLYADYCAAKPILRKVFEEDLEWYFGDTELGLPKAAT